MEIIYNKFFSNIIKNNKDKNKETSETINVEVSETNLLSDSSNEVNSKNDSTEMPSSISSIDSIESCSSDTNKKNTKVRFNEKIKISEITLSSDKDATNTSKMEEIENSNDNEETIKTEESYVDEDSEDYYNNENYDNSSNNEVDDKLTIETAIEKKYLNSINLNKKKYYEEIKELEASNYRNLELNVLKNSYLNVLNALSNGDVLYKKDDKYNIIKICSNKSCNSRCEKKNCNKSGLYYSLWNNVRGVKTIYNLLLKLIILYPKFRKRCKCCEDNQLKNYLEKLENNFEKNIFNYEEDNIYKLELKINYLINKFMSVIGIMTCQCKFLNKYYEFYQDNYLNFRKSIQIYKRTVTYIVIMLKAYFNVKENHEELSLIKVERCMHEDIRYNNMSYCLKKKYNLFEKKKLQEIIYNLELVNNWSVESFEISFLLFNQQSLETFRHVLYKYKKEINIVDLFKKIYDKKNNIINLNYIVNKKNLVNSILSTIKNQKNLEYEKSKILINNIINQLLIKNRKYKDIQSRINEMMLQYVVECYNFGNIKLGIEFFKNIKDLNNKNFITKITKNIDFNKYSIINSFPDTLNKNSNYIDLIKYIFDNILESSASYQIKISYLKIINKNKINIINYDFINKLIDIEEGEKIILDFTKQNKNENNNYYFLSLPDYDNINYINTIIKKCIIKRRVNILDYFLSEINSRKNNEYINPFIIYFSNIDDYRVEKEYIGLLNVIIKYNYNINNYVLTENGTSKNDLNFLHYCIRKKLNESGKILLQRFVNTDLIYENKNFLFYCIDNKNHVIFAELLNFNSTLINHTYNNLKLQTYLILNRELNENLLMRFMMKLLSNKNFKVNYYDKYNTHIGFQILESNLTKRNKIILFKIISEQIEPMVIKNNIPLIMNTVIMDEYEITYLLLDKLFTSKNVKKIPNNIQCMEYEYISDKISINFIPLIFKYIKDNSNKNKILIDEIYLEIDAYIENILVMIIELVVYILIFKNNNYKNKYKKEELNEYVEYKNNELNKKYNKNKLGEVNNGYVEISLETDENLSLVNVNKNIWKNPNKININDKIANKLKTRKEISDIKLNFKSETIENNDESSEIEESNICFDSMI